MKTVPFFFVMFCSVLSFAQSEGTLIQNERADDTYLAGNKISVNAVIRGDLIAAGRDLTFSDSIYGDLVAAGASLSIEKWIADDVRVAAAKVIVDSEIGDDLVVSGGEVFIKENAIIIGNLICAAQNIVIDGEILGKLDIKGGNVTINGEIHETSKIVSDNIIIGSKAQFHKDVEYWSRAGQIDFKESLVNSKAQFIEELKAERPASPLSIFGFNSIISWLVYVLSTFLAILVFNGLFRNTFSKAVEGFDKHYLKSFGFGLIYLLGVPIVIAVTFMIVIGIPLGLLMTGIFLFSLWFGHIIAALLITYYIKQKNRMNWNFWGITLIALLFTVVLRLISNIPFIGIVISIVVLAITYGVLTLKVLYSKRVPA